MNTLDNRTYRLLEVFANFVLLNLLWLIACIPIFTIYPATAAMFSVVREWIRDNEIGVLRTFLAFFRVNFKQSFWIGVLWTSLGIALTIDFLLVTQMTIAIIQVVLFALITLTACLYLGISVWLFPMIANFRTGWRTLLKDSLLFAIGRLGTTFECMFVVGAVVVVTVVAPFAAMITGSLTAYLVYRLCDRSFQEMATLRGYKDLYGKGYTRK